MVIDLSQLDEHSESEHLELKESFDKQTLETIGAFANTSGGTILVGVRDDGHVTGITVGKTTLEEWAQKMQSKIQPRILPSILKHDYKGRTVVAITVDHSEGPVCIDGRYLKRVGRTNQVMSPEEAKRKLLAGSSASWDNQTEDSANMADLAEEAIEQFVARLNRAGRRPIPAGETHSSTLEKLGLTVKGQPTRAAVLLLGKDPKRFYPMAFVKAGRFKSAVTILDDREFNGTLFHQMDGAMAWLMDRIETRFLIGPSMKLSKEKPAGSPLEREEVWQYPLPALREALANAVCHRDYRSGVATTVRVYDKRLEVWNPGSLPPDLPVEALLREHTSHSPNRLLAECFFNTGIIERWGSGTLRMAAALEEQDQPQPEFDISTPNLFKVIMFASGYTNSKLRELGLNDRQIGVIHYLRLKDAIVTSEYQAWSGASKATATRDLGELVLKGFIRREGKGTAVSYTLVEPR